MKKVIPVLLFALLVANTNKLSAQGCPTIVNSTFRFHQDPSDPCIRWISFDFINPTSGNKRIRVKIDVGSTTVLDDCYNASGQNGVQRTYTSEPFTACNIYSVIVSITGFAGNTCDAGAFACYNPQISIGGSPLPVLFKSFSVNRDQQNVSLKWVTATEIDNKGFIIERNDNGNWMEAGYIATKAIDGNSIGELSYQFSDMNNNKGMTQYRIKQVDNNGSFKYSEIRAIQGTDQDAKVTIFPNPGKDGKVNMVFASAAIRDIAVIDMAGRTVKQFRSFSANSLQISGLNPGMYTVRANNLESGAVNIEKFMIAAN
jgi:hypothetical protein